MKHRNAWRNDFEETYAKGRIDFNKKEEPEPELGLVLNSKVNNDFDIPFSPLDDVDTLAAMLPPYHWKLTYDNDGYCLNYFSHMLNSGKSTHVRSFSGPSHKSVYMAALKYLIEEENFNPDMDGQLHQPVTI